MNIEISKTRSGYEQLAIIGDDGYIQCVIHCVDGERLYGYTFLRGLEPDSTFLCRLQEITAKDILHAVLPFQKEPEQC